jgi:hypothetical protein
VLDDYRSEFFAALTVWTESDPSGSESLSGGDRQLGARLEQLAPVEFPVLKDADEQLALDAFLAALPGTRRDVAVRCLLAARRERDLASGLVADVLHEPLWKDAASWYVNVRDCAALSGRERKALVEALCEVLPSEHVEGFAYELARICEAVEISGVIDDPVIPAHLRAHLVTSVVATYTSEAPDLEAVADAPEFMSLAT